MSVVKSTCCSSEEPRIISTYMQTHICLHSSHRKTMCFFHVFKVPCMYILHRQNTHTQIITTIMEILSINHLDILCLLVYRNHPVSMILRFIFSVTMVKTKYTEGKVLQVIHKCQTSQCSGSWWDLHSSLVQRSHTVCVLPFHQIHMEFNTIYVFMCPPSV